MVIRGKQGGYIMNNKVNTLQLYGEDAYNFACSLFRPSKEAMERIKSSADAVNNIVINRLDNGFEAEIEDLDLSFLDEILNENNITVETVMHININGLVHNSDMNNCNSMVVNRLTICDNVKYSNAVADELFMVAA